MTLRVDDEKGVVAFELRDAKGRVLGRLSAGAAESFAGLEFLDPSGRVRIRMGTDAKGESLLELLGEDGKTLWTPPVGKPGGR
jgi:hypothetical protein